MAGFPPPEAVEHLRSAVAGLRLWQAAAAGGTVRMPTPDSWHLTVAFLGPVAERRPEIEAAVDGGVRHWRSGASEPLALRLGGGGRFGSGRSAVVWVGVSGAVAELTRLSDAIRTELTRCGVLPDERPFRAHLTLARPGTGLSAVAIQADLAALDRYLGPRWTLDRLDLVASHSGPQRRYERLWSVPVAP